MKPTSRFSNFLRATSFVLLLALTLQDIVYADPDLLLKSSTLAQKTLITGDDKTEDFKRVAVVHMETAAAKDPGFGTVWSAAEKLRDIAAKKGLSPNQIPSVSGSAVSGYIKITFADGAELVFYNPAVARSSNGFGGGVLHVAGKRALPDKLFSSRLWSRMIVPAGQVQGRQKRARSYKSMLKELIQTDERAIAELKKAIDTARNPRGRTIKNIRGIRIVQSAVSILAAEYDIGLVSAEAMRFVISAVDRARTFGWTTRAQRNQMNSLNHHIRKAMALRLEANGLLDKLDGYDWRTYLLPETTDTDKEMYFADNFRDILMRLRNIIERLPENYASLGARLRELYAKLARSKDLNRDNKGSDLYASARAFQSISEGKHSHDSISDDLSYLAIRCRTLAELMGCVETPPGPDKQEEIKSGGIRQLELGLDLGEKYPGMRARVNVKFGIFLAVTLSFTLALLSGANIHEIIYAAGATGLVYLLAGRLAQEKFLDYYIKNLSRILMRVRDGEISEEDKIRGIYEEIFNAYRLFLIRDMTQKRKKLISTAILSNIISPDEIERDKTAKPDEKRFQSHKRSQVAIDFMMKRIFASRDPMIFRPALEAVIELLAKYPKYFWKRLLPLLEESERLPRFAKALVDVLIRAEKDDVKLFELEDRQMFIAQGKNIIVELSEKSPKLRNEIISYLLDVSERSGEEAELIHDMLDRIGFIIAPSEEFSRTAATQIVEAIGRIRTERSRDKNARKTINIVLTGGDTMPGFLGYLARIMDKDTLRNIHIYQLCEYDGFAPDYEHSIASFIDRHIPQLIPKENRHYINGMRPDNSYMQKLEQAGGADITILGIGVNGRLGFIEPADVFDGASGSLAVTRFNGSAAYLTGPVAAHAGHTMRISDILGCRNIFLLAKGVSKADIIKRALFGEITARIPASALQRTRHIRVVLDMGIMDKLSPKYKERYKKRIARKLTELETRSRDLFDDSPTPQHEMDRDCIILRANMAEAKMLGYDSPEDIIGHHITDFIHPEDVDRAKERIAKKLATTGGRLEPAEARYLTKDGQVINVLIRDHRIISPDGEMVIGMQSTLTDITRYKLMERELAELKGLNISDSPRQKIEDNARRIAALLVNALLAQDAAHKKEKIVLALDGKLGHIDEIRALINKYVVEALSMAGAGRGDLKKVFENLVLIDGEAGLLSQRLISIIDSSKADGRQKIKKENIVIVTADSDRDLFKEFESASFITSVDDSGLKAEEADDGKLNYYPMLELIFFSVARMVISSQDISGQKKDDLWQWYKSIPNIEDLDRTRFEGLVYDQDGALKRTILLKLIPRAGRFDKDELRVIYERIREFITKA